MTDLTAKAYWIPENHLQELTDKLTKIGRRAVKLGLPAISFEVGAHHDRAFVRTRSGGLEPVTAGMEAGRLEPLKVVYIRFFHVTVTGQTPRLAGWKFVATLQHFTGEEGQTVNMLRTVPTFEGELPADYRTAMAENCDHCQRAIKTRKGTFVVRHEDGTWKQVGRNCIQDFLGGLDPHEVTKGLELLLQAFGAAGDWEEGFGGEGGLEPRWGLLNYLAAVATMVRTGGWLSKGRAREEDRPHMASANLALQYLEPPEEGTKARADWDKWHLEIPETPEDLDTATKALDYARETLSEKTDRNDYEHNLYVATIQETVDQRLTGIAASLIPYYIREVERRALRTAELRGIANSKPVGQIGKRMVLDVQVLRVFEVGLNNPWGPSYLHRLATTDGNLVIWFSGQENNNLRTGDSYSVKATPKSFETRDGIMQTVVSRLVPLTPEEAEKEKTKAAKKAAREAGMGARIDRLQAKAEVVK